jgi:diguanylate cyclase (GGDEF)-like protein
MNCVSCEHSFFVFKGVAMADIRKIFKHFISISKTKDYSLKKEFMYKDPITGVYNNRMFNETLTKLIDFEKNACNKKQVSLLLIDVSNFNIINKKYGFLSGDIVLKNIADVIKRNLNKNDILSRYEGVTFAVIMEGKDQKNAARIGEKIRDEVFNYFKNDSRINHDSHNISLGIASYPEITEDISQLFDHSVEALSHSKNSRSNEVKIYNNYFSFLDKQDLEDSELIKIIKILLTIIDTKDNYTYGHSERVAGYIYEFGKNLGMNERELNTLFISALIHDIGKIEISNEILNKKGKLTEKEYETVKTHTNIGGDIVSKIENIKKLHNVVRYHHERYDGKGYPDGLLGEEIPFEARMLAIADSYDAMLSRRPYRRGMNIKEALDEITKNAGSQFDPFLAGIFIEMIIGCNKDLLYNI